MPIYRLSNDSIDAVKPTAFSALGVTERHDLQRLLRDNIGVIDPDVLIVSEEFGWWEISRRRIDLLGIYKDANIVVIELKRTEDGGHMSPEQIDESIDWRRNLFFAVDGEATSAAVMAQIESGTGSSSDPGRWFYDDDELIRFGDHTYAFLKKWGPRTEEAMRKLTETFQEEDISFERAQ